MENFILHEIQTEYVFHITHIKKAIFFKAVTNNIYNALQ